MKILLCGDYSSVHSVLAESLKSKRHNVTVLSDGDSYKDFPADIKIELKKGSRSLILKLANLFLDWVGIAGICNYVSFRRKVSLSNYDIIQVINPVIISQFGALGNFLFFRYLESKTNSIYLCALGDDSRWVAACLRKRYKYSPLDKLSKTNFAKYYYSLKYVISPAYLYLNRYAERKVKAVIAGLDDYRIAYDGSNKIHRIRLPVSPISFVAPPKKVSPNLVIFHAWQKGKELKKGNDILHEAAVKIVQIYGEINLRYMVASGMKYKEFVESFKDCDIVLDQTYSYEGGVTAALGMSAGKLVFSGFELFERYSKDAPFNIKKIGVNATGNLDELVECLSYLIENPLVVSEIRYNAHKYALTEHASGKITSEYLRVWGGGACKL